MGLTLKESNALAGMAEVLYEFLPGSGNERWKGHVSFRTVAREADVGTFWQQGSKLPAITALLERTLEFRRDRFERLIIGIVRAGIVYRKKKRCPIKRSEVEKLSALLNEVEFRFPDLCDENFLTSLEVSSDQRTKEFLDASATREKLREANSSRRAIELEELKTMLFELVAHPDRHDAGRALQELLTGLFHHAKLAPREPFRVSESRTEIDGSFELDHEVYLVEAKWERSKLDHIPLDVFLKKIRDRSGITRGVLVAMNNVTQPAIQSIRGQDRIFIIVDGADLMSVVHGAIGLKELLRGKLRLLGDKGLIYVPGNQVKQDLG